ncbi:hypothetical protein [Flavobacterium sp.]
MNLNVTSSECDWAKFEVQILGRTVKGLRGFALKKEKDIEEVYGAGPDPLDLNEGNNKYSGSVKLLGFEVDAMNKAAKEAGYDDLTEVPHEALVLSLSFKKKITDALSTYTVRGLKFTEWGAELDQGAKHRETTLPFKAMSIY